ncbi:unnamed protein product, partial [Vitis vinifera]
MSSLVLACPLGKFSKLKISQWPIFTLTFGVTSSCPTLQKTRKHGPAKRSRLKI